jgi:Glycosyl transferase family 2
MPVPVALFVYNRPRHTRATLEALARNTLASQTDLHVFSDGAKGQSDRQAVAEVRRMVRNPPGFASVRVVERPVNTGLANSIITGVSAMLASHHTVIVLEDDLVSSPHFLGYMNAALEHYRSDPRVFSVTGYVYPPEQIKVPPDYPYDTFPGYRCSSWGWGTWGDRWRRVRWDMDYFDSFSKDTDAQEEFNRGGQDMSVLLRLQYEKKVDSWAIRFCYAHFTNNMRCIYPVKSLIRNIGLDDTGTHSSDARYSGGSLDRSWLPKVFSPTESEDPRVTENFRAIFDPTKNQGFMRLARRPWELASRIGHHLFRRGGG